MFTRYYTTHWLPRLGGNGHLIVTVLRLLRCDNRKTGDNQDGIDIDQIDIDQKDLAKLCGLSVRTLQREFLENRTLARFVRREFEIIRDRAGRITREHYLYRIQRDDPPADEDQPEAEPATLTPIPSSGYVYLLAARNGVYKIGKTVSLETRVQQIVPKLPFECKLLHAIQSEDHAALEVCLHRLFAGRRLNGEWFRLTRQEVRWLMSQKQLNASDFDSGLYAAALREERREGTSDPSGRVGDPLAVLSPDEYTALEHRAREKVIAELGPPICDLARQGKARRDVKAMMRALLAGQGG